jgi:hypothetical protein
MKKLALGALALSLLSGCGGDGTPVVGPSPVPTAAPSASITATGGGVLVVHPSINLVYLAAIEAPIRITETSGGSADWTFARMSLFRGGVEIERSEMGADALQVAGFGRIPRNSTQVYRTIFRFNADDFDRIDLTLGFTDLRDGRQFTAIVPIGSFTNVDLSVIPLSRSSLPL